MNNKISDKILRITSLLKEALIKAGGQKSYKELRRIRTKIVVEENKFYKALSNEQRKTFRKIMGYTPDGKFHQ